MAHAAICRPGRRAAGVPRRRRRRSPTQVVGDGDAFIEPNETWNLTVPLTNIGGATATAISAVLSTSTPGVTVDPAQLRLPGPRCRGLGQQHHALPLLGRRRPRSAAASIDFTLTVTYTGGPSPQVFNFSLGTGSPGTPRHLQLRRPVVPIPDVARARPAIATLPVAGVARQHPRRRSPHRRHGLQRRRRRPPPSASTTPSSPTSRSRCSRPATTSVRGDQLHRRRRQQLLPDRCSTTRAPDRASSRW